MPKRRKAKILWDISQPWEVNIATLIEAQRAQRDDWSATRRFEQAAKVEAVHRKRRRAASRRWAAKHDARPRRVPPAPGRRRRDQILRAMVPGEWYAVPDIAAASGVPYRSVQPTLYQRLWPEGLVERAQDEAWRAGVMPRAPQVLWRLTVAGEAARELAVVLE